MVFRPDIQKTVYTDYRHSTCLSNKILNLFPTKSISCAIVFGKARTMSEKSMFSSMSDSILITAKEVSWLYAQPKKCLGCMQLLRWFLTIFSLENERSPMQFVGIMVKYICNAISMYGNVDSRLSALIRLYISYTVGCGTVF